MADDRPPDRRHRTYDRIRIAAVMSEVAGRELIAQDPDGSPPGVPDGRVAMFRDNDECETGRLGRRHHHGSGRRSTVETPLDLAHVAPISQVGRVAWFRASPAS
jgi:hypothetical protein